MRIHRPRFTPETRTWANRNHWLHVICACAEWYSRSCISQAVAVHWDIKYAENWWLWFMA